MWWQWDGREWLGAFGNRPIERESGSATDPFFISGDGQENMFRSNPPKGPSGRPPSPHGGRTWQWLFDHFNSHGWVSQLLPGSRLQPPLSEKEGPTQITDKKGSLGIIPW